jgi:hypothetical protein
MVPLDAGLNVVIYIQRISAAFAQMGHQQSDCAASQQIDQLRCAKPGDGEPTKP